MWASLATEADAEWTKLQVIKEKYVTYKVTYKKV